MKPSSFTAFSSLQHSHALTLLLLFHICFICISVIASEYFYTSYYSEPYEGHVTTETFFGLFVVLFISHSFGES